MDLVKNDANDSSADEEKIIVEMWGDEYWIIHCNEDVIFKGEPQSTTLTETFASYLDIDTEEDDNPFGEHDPMVLVEVFGEETGLDIQYEPHDPEELKNGEPPAIVKDEADEECDKEEWEQDDDADKDLQVNIDMSQFSPSTDGGGEGEPVEDDGEDYGDDDFDEV